MWSINIWRTIVTTLTNMTTEYINNITKDLNYKGDEIFSKLILDKDSYINSLPESIFVNYFLPFFMGNNSNPNWILEWISIAGAPAMEVRVFKDNTNETLYYVPPLLDTNNIMLANAGNNFGNIFARYKMYCNNIPMEGTKFLMNELNNKTNELQHSVNTDHENVWMGILHRYNLIPQSVVGQTVQADNDYLEY